jgi:hypothetical protein
MPLIKIPTNQSELQEALAVSFQEITDLAIAVSEAKFYEEANSKWSIGNVDHLIMSSFEIVSMTARPKAIFEQFGKAERPSRGYEELVETYKEVLSKGRKAPTDYSPVPDTPKDREELLQSMQMLQTKLAKRLSEHWTEEELDTYRLPHPAMGMMTMREILAFTVLHNYHHLEAMEAIAKG